MATGDRIALNFHLYTVSEGSLRSMPARVEKEVQAAVYRLAQQTRDVARSLCPVDTGALRASIYAAGPGGGATSVGGQSTTGYFRAVNAAIRRGTRGVPGEEGFRQRLSRLGGGLAGHRTQRPTGLATGGSADAPAQLSQGVSEFGGHAFRSYSRGSGSIQRAVQENKNRAAGHVPFSETEFETPSIMEMGHAGRGSFFTAVGAAAGYAGDVEFGHVVSLGGNTFGRVEARPFMRPALAWAKMRLNAVVAEAVKRGLAR